MMGTAVWGVLTLITMLVLLAVAWFFRAGDKVAAVIETPVVMGRPAANVTALTLRRAPTREAFEAWLEDPLTQFVMAALIRNADECADKWLNDSWQGGVADQRQLDGLRERADTLRGIATAGYEAFCETLNLEPQGDEDAA